MKKIFWLLIPVYFMVLGGCGDPGPVEQSWGRMKGLEDIVGNIQGHTLFVHVGYLNGEQIKQVIDYYRTGWEKWSETGEEADWMASR